MPAGHKATGTTEFTLALTGQSLIKRDIGIDHTPAFRAVIDRIRAADLAFTNFEGTVLGRHGGWPMKGAYFGGVAPEMLRILRDLGFGALSLANNHAFDLGPAGVLSTMEEAERCGFLHAGLGHDTASAARSGLRNGVALVAMDAGPAGEHCYAQDGSAEAPGRPGMNPLRVVPRVLLPADELATIRRIEAALVRPLQGVSFGEGEAIRREHSVDAADRARNLGAIRAAADAGCRVIAYVHHHHWEPRWEDVPGWARQFGRDCIEAGASVYVSHGVPVLQGIELHRGRPIFHSLGNFIFHSRHGATRWSRDEVWQSVVASVRFDGHDIRRIELMPVVIGGEAALQAADFSARDVPHRAGAAKGSEILERLAGLSAEFGTRLRIEDGLGVIES